MTLCRRQFDCDEQVRNKAWFHYSKKKAREKNHKNPQKKDDKNTTTIMKIFSIATSTGGTITPTMWLLWRELQLLLSPLIHLKYLIRTMITSKLRQQLLRKQRVLLLLILKLILLLSLYLLLNIIVSKIAKHKELVGLWTERAVIGTSCFIVAVILWRVNLS